YFTDTFLLYLCDRRTVNSFPTRRSSDVLKRLPLQRRVEGLGHRIVGTRPDPAHRLPHPVSATCRLVVRRCELTPVIRVENRSFQDRKSTRLNSSHVKISYAVFCLKKKIN